MDSENLMGKDQMGILFLVLDRAKCLNFVFFFLIPKKKFLEDLGVGQGHPLSNPPPPPPPPPKPASGQDSYL
jgi:hypothetical protein